MRITRESLLRLARDSASLRTHQDRSIVTIYLVGSLLTEEPLLGGTTDIDLVLIHDSQPAQAREIVPMSDEIHLDIAHHSQARYEQPRQLRIDPWLGPAIHDHPLVLVDRQHWFEFTQASAGSQFGRADYVIGRARPFASAARQGWLKLHTSVPDSLTLADFARVYFQSLEDAANAVSSLSGAPLTERRFLSSFLSRAQAINQAGLDAGLAGLTGETYFETDLATSWLPGWKEAFLVASRLPQAPLRLHPARLSYYEKAILALLASPRPGHALWPLLLTWTQAIHCLPPGSPQTAAWEEAAGQLHLGLVDQQERVEGLDSYLDRVEEVLDLWARNNGATDAEAA